jgi:hypothetical protein
VQAFNCAFPSLVDIIHIVGPLNEITHAFDYLSTELTLVGLRVKVSKCKLWSPSKISPGIEILQGYTLVIDGLCILGVPVGSLDFATHRRSSSPRRRPIYFGHFVLMCNSSTFLSHTNNTSSFFFVSFGEF